MTMTVYTHAVFFCFKCRQKTVHEVDKTYYQSFLEKIKTVCLNCGKTIERKVYGKDESGIDC